MSKIAEARKSTRVKITTFTVLHRGCVTFKYIPQYANPFKTNTPSAKDLQ